MTKTWHFNVMRACMPNNRNKNLTRVSFPVFLWLIDFFLIFFSDHHRPVDMVWRKLRTIWKGKWLFPDNEMCWLMTGESRDALLKLFSERKACYFLHHLQGKLLLIHAHTENLLSIHLQTVKNHQSITLDIAMPLTVQTPIMMKMMVFRGFRTRMVYHAWDTLRILFRAVQLQGHRRPRGSERSSSNQQWQPP